MMTRYVYGPADHMGAACRTQMNRREIPILHGPCEPHAEHRRTEKVHNSRVAEVIAPTSSIPMREGG